MEPAAARRAAELLGRARLAGEVVSPLPPDYRPTDEAEAYDIQAALHGWLSAAGLGVRAGYKIGCTTLVMQRLVGVAGPAAGGIMKRTVHDGHAVFAAGAFRNPGAECEIAVRIGEEIGPAAAPCDRARIAASLDACMVAMEIVDNRYGDFLSMGAPMLIADDFFNAACILGRPVTDWRDLDLGGLTGRTIVDGVVAGTGRGADVMGHPLEAVAWLANLLAGRGRTLAAGEIVLTGSVVETQWIPDAATEVTVSVDGLGEVGAVFEAAQEVLPPSIL